MFIIREKPGRIMERNRDHMANLEDLQKVVAALRAPDGCPWDREQTHESLKPCCVEEASEVVSGINILKETGNADNLKEELGDLLLQVVMHAQIAEEEGLFTMEDVIGGITEKMVRRHPHVFGETDDAGKAADLGRTGSGRENICCAEPGQTDHGQIVNRWAEIKKREKAGKEWMDQYLPKAFAEFRDLIDRAEERKFKKEKKYSYFAHRQCEYFPCHKGADPENFNCLFCYCPLYVLGDRCGGNFVYREDGRKVCTNCQFPHRRENYEKVLARYPEILAVMKNEQVPVCSGPNL